MARTQMRLDAVTGSLVAIDGITSSAAAPGTIGAENLEQVLGQFAGAIKRIHGDAAFTNQVAGKFVHATSQFVGDVSGSANLKVSGNITGSADVLLDKAGDTVVNKVGGNLRFAASGPNRVIARADGLDRLIVSASRVETTVLAVLSGAQVNDLGGGDGSLVFRDNFRVLKAAPAVVWDGSKFGVAGAISGSGAFTGASAAFDGALSAGGLASLNGGIAVDGTKFTVADSSGNVKTEGSLEVDGTATLASAVVEDLTPTHVVFVGTGDVLSGSGDMTYNAATSVLTVKGSSFGQDVTVAGNLTVNGTTTTVNSTTLQVDDKNIELAHSPGGAAGNDAAVDGGGITLVSSEGNKTISWSNSSKFWEFSEGIKAPSGSFSNLASKLVKADGTGKLVDALAMDFITGTLNQVNLAAGSLAGSVVLSLPQSIATTSNVQFAQITGSMIVGTSYVSGAKLYSDVKSAEYMYADGSGELKAGSFQASGADMVISDALGSVTYSLKFPISGSSPHDTLVGTNYMGDDLSVFEALRSLDAQLFSVSGATLAKKARAVIGAAGVAANADMAGQLKDAAGSALNFLNELTEGNGMIFVNGQLMLETADYALDTSAKTLKFTFALVEDDVIVVQKA